MKVYTDKTLAPFGKYGPNSDDHRTLEEVPAGYLLTLWDFGDGLWDGKTLARRYDHMVERYGERSVEAMRAEERLALHNYIKQNFKALEMDASDLIIRHYPA